MDSFVLKTGNYFGRKFLLFVVVFKVVAHEPTRVSDAQNEVNRCMSSDQLARCEKYQKLRLHFVRVIHM